MKIYMDNDGLHIEAPAATLNNIYNAVADALAHGKGERPLYGNGSGTLIIDKELRTGTKVVVRQKEDR